MVYGDRRGQAKPGSVSGVRLASPAVPRRGHGWGKQMLAETGATENPVGKEIERRRAGVGVEARVGFTLVASLEEVITYRCDRADPVIHDQHCTRTVFVLPCRVPYIPMNRPT